jgi:hypothetical protein
MLARDDSRMMPEVSRIRTGLAALAATALIMAVGDVPADAGWTERLVSGSDARAVSPLTFGFTGDGRGVLGWNGLRDGSDQGASVFGSVLGIGGPAPAMRLADLTDPYSGGRLVLVAPRRWALVGQDAASETRRGGRVWVRIGPLGGRLGTPRTLFRKGAVLADVATGPRGDLAVTVRRFRRPRPNPFGFDGWVAIVRPDGALRRVRVGRAVDRLVPAVNARGDVVVVFDRPRWNGGEDYSHRYAVRLLPRSGTLRPAQAVGSARAPELEGYGARTSHDLVAALAADRRAVVGWHIEVCEEAACFGGPTAVAVARRGGEFGRPIPISAGQVVRLAVTAGAGAVVAWSAWSGDSGDVRRADVTGRALGAQQRVSTPGMPSILMGLASGPRNAAALLWTESPTGHPFFNPAAPATLLASVRPSGGAFGVAEAVSQRQVEFGFPAAIAFDPFSGIPATAWQAGDQTNRTFVVARRSP